MTAGLLARSPLAWLTVILLLAGLAAPLLANGRPLVAHVKGGGWLFPALSDDDWYELSAVLEETPKRAVGVLRAPIPYSPAERVLDNHLQPPSTRHWFGTDHIGRDVASRLIHGTRVSLGIGLLATAFALLVGLAVGGAAGYAGGWVDLLLSRVIEVFASFPALILAMTFVTFVSPGILSLAVVIAVVGWTGIARHARAEALRIRGEVFVEAARAAGAGRFRILCRQVLPQTLYIVAVPAAFLLARAILAESALSMLGVGVSEPTASWGNVLALSRSYLRPAWWLALFPGCFLALTLTLCNRWGERLSGRGARDTEAAKAAGL